MIQSAASRIIPSKAFREQWMRGASGVERGPYGDVPPGFMRRMGWGGGGGSKWVKCSYCLKCYLLLDLSHYVR